MSGKRKVPSVEVVVANTAIAMSTIELERLSAEAYERGLAAGRAERRCVTLVVREWPPHARDDTRPHLRRFTIETAPGEASIVREGRPLIERDTSWTISVGREPAICDVSLAVEPEL